MLEGAHPDRRERARGSRAAHSLRRELRSFAWPIAFAVGLFTLPSTLGCDQGHHDDQQIVVGPPIELIPASSAGSRTNIGDKDLPADQPIVLQFNRLLNPNSVTRQSIQLLTSSRNLLADPIIAYDPVLMTVTLTNPGGGMAWLVEGQSYEISFPVPQNPSDTNGLQTIDDATFATPTQVAFAVTKASGTVSADPTMHFCVDILPIFTASCGGASCHGSPSPGAMPSSPAGLVLDNSEGVALTAIGRVAHGSNTGASAGVSASPGTVFGVDMPIVDPGTNGTGDPANSWLLYKLLLAVPSPPDADGGAVSQCKPHQTSSYDRDTESPAAMSQERAILSNFILGNQMPYPSNPASPQTGLTVQELERIRLWIAQGAPLELVPGQDGGTTMDCSQCAQFPESADGG